NAARFRSVTQAIAESILPLEDRQLIEFTQNLEASAGAFGIGGGASAERKYSIAGTELLLRAFTSARKQAGDRQAVIALDNLEAVFDKQELMDELGNIILLLDDPRYARHNVKFIIVGVPSDIIDYYQKIENLEPVGNRIKEISSVTALSSPQISDFVRRGFTEQLKISFAPFEFKDMCTHIESVTLGIAQRLHEYSEALAFRIEENEWRYKKDFLEDADNSFMKSSLKKSYAVVESHMNERRTKTGRRNQVLYSLGKMSRTVFEVADVETSLRAEFPDSTQSVMLAIGQMLSELADGRTPLLRRNSRGNSYRFVDPRHLMCLRIMLVKSDTGERVNKRLFRR
ncbi:MAG TPA: hypothetical protein VK178_14790, partial [Opitutaceae bacterium]|nr:hypothetical protein [Opitutaceae bacterium]